MSLRVLFMGTPDFAVPTLEALLSSPHRVVAVVTQPDKPAGRGRKPRPSPVKQLALQAGLEVMEPQRAGQPENLEAIRQLQPEVAVVVAYGQILPPSLLGIPPLGCLNLHASILPRHRGAAPIAWAILCGDAVTGVSVIQMDEGLDTGPVMACLETPIGPQEDARGLSARLSALGAELVVETLGRLESGSIVPSPQNEEEATYAPKLRKEDGRICWEHGAERISRQVRAMVPWPMAYTSWRGRQLRILKARPLPMQAWDRPGRILKAKGRSLWVATGDGILEVLELQPEAKQPMGAQAFISGRGAVEGEILGGGCPGHAPGVDGPLG
jgi:methionyl-tRNA formyltransferase